MIHIYKFLLLYFILFFTNAKSFAQSPSYYQYETSNGLPTNEIYDVKQDKQGFLWLGTDAGLVRYDGTDFKIYNNNLSRGTAISCLQTDKNGIIWCTNFAGQIFFINHDSLALFLPFEKKYRTQFSEIAFGNNGHLFITNATNYLYNFNQKSNTFYVIGSDTNYLSFPHNAFNNDILFSVIKAPVTLVLLENNIQKNISFYNNKNEILNNSFLNKFILSNSNKNLQTLCFQSFNPANTLPYLFYYSNKKMLQHPITTILQALNAYPQSVFADDEGSLFIGTAKGLLWFKQDNHHNWQLFNTMFLGNSISVIKKDNEGSLWIGTLKNGIYKIPNSQVYELKDNEYKPKSIGINKIVTNGVNSIYVSHLSGEVYEYNTKTKKKYLFNTPEERDVQSLKYDHYNKELFICKNTSFIVNTLNKSIKKAPQNFTNTKDLSFTKNGVYYKPNNVLEIIFNPSDNLVEKKLLLQYDTVYANNYLSKSKNNNTWKSLILKTQRCKSVCYDESNKTLWAGFVDGLVYFKNKRQYFLNASQNNTPIIASKITLDSSSKLVYVSTIKQGIFVIKNEKIVQQISTNNGLYANEIKSFRIYKNLIWLIAKNKVQCFNTLTNNIKTIDTEDGLLSNELYDVEVLNDTVFVASSKGLQYFPVDIQSFNTISPISIIETFVADDSLYINQATILLKPSTKNIAITLLGISLKSNGNMKYQYRLLPNDSNWITVSANQNIVRYTLLSNDNYTFESRVINEDGLVSNNISKQNFIVLKPWYLKWWFIVISAIVFVLLFFVFYKYRLHLQQQKFNNNLQNAKVQEELRKSQLVSLKAQMNPHFMFNALNSIQEFIITNDKQSANMYLGKFADLMRITLDMSNKESVSLQDELKCINLYLALEGLRFEDTFNFIITIDKSVEIENIFLPSMLIQPYIENAIKHGLLHKPKDRKLFINFTLVDKNILGCTIIDNGIGRKRSNEINTLRQKKHTSFATGATQNRLELLNHKKTVSITVKYTDLIEKETGVGTEVSIHIPI